MQTKTPHDSEQSDSRKSSFLNDAEKGKIPYVDKGTGTESAQGHSTLASYETRQNKVANQQTHPPTLDDWDGPDDPDNAHNWPMRLRIYHSVVPALFGFAV
jgi:hypothetical protein